jgi:hypothetical protein
MLKAIATGRDDTARETAERLQDIMEVSFVLEAVIELAKYPDGLDFLPECEGKCGDECQPPVHPRDRAAMN